MLSHPTLPNASDRTASSGDVLVRVDGVSKKFCRDLKKSLFYGVCDVASEMVGRSTSPHLRKKEFYAVSDVSFELRRGECLGLIGRNGAGKTTLLKMLNGLIKPDRGRIEIRGRVAALIALGAGFNPILTGRENIYVNASVLGLTKKETDEKFDEIVDFADIGDFIDSPVQSYSSGMQVRLGFAVATALNPDVLLLDEVLAVGDAAFRAKCFRRVGKLLDRCAVIFVSHVMEHVQRICSSSLVLHEGEVVLNGTTSDAILYYQKLNTPGGQEDREGAFLQVHDPLTGFEVSNVERVFRHGQKLTVEIRAGSTVPTVCRLLFQIYDETDMVVSECDDLHIEFPDHGSHNFRIELGPLHLKPGRYHVSVLCTAPNGLNLLAWSFKKIGFTVEGSFNVIASYIAPRELVSVDGISRRAGGI